MALKACLETSRLVSLVGSGGVGISRLALELGINVLQDFSEGVWLVELAPVSQPDLITQLVVSSLKIQLASGKTPLENLVQSLQNKTLLLILDNYEHLLEPTALLVNELLKACPLLKILTTSREALGLGGELIWSTSPLSLPPVGYEGLNLSTIENYEALLLFVERAKNVQPKFTLRELEIPSLVQLCRWLDGLQLALELAAARTNMLLVEQLLKRLQDQPGRLNGWHK